VCVFREHGIYHLNFISYEEGEDVLYSRLEDEKEFHKVPFSLPFNITKHHKAYYTQPQLRKEVVLTYQQQNDKIYITGHNSVFDSHEDDKTIFHIEMNTIFDTQYFSKLSKELGVEIATSEKKPATRISSLLDKQHDNQYIDESTAEYRVSFLLDKKPNPIFITVSLDKRMLLNTLNQNRESVITFILVAVVMLIGVFHILLRFGLSKPLGKLMQRVQKIEQGDYSPSKPIKTGDELERVATEIEALALAVSNREHALKASQQELEYLSKHDALTGLLNRRSFLVKFEYIR